MKEPLGGRTQRGTRSETPIDAPNAALLIDFDNVTMGIRSDLQNQLRKLLNSDIIKGKVSVQRAYADWRRYPQYIVPLSEASIDLIFAPAFGANKKNATDIRLAIDALELIFIRPEIGVFILLSGDSDFSALVLKLKEYGKYVIGVGIRESSSDLLIQNCDEYYSYSEITGLSKEGEIEHTRKDPWALAVQAARQMESEGDVMRSDRLKQVMQSMDPNFDERDVGFNKFSKFVVAAGQRGLLSLSKMDNGQFAVQVGPNANVPSADFAGGEGNKAVEQVSEKAHRRSSHRPAQPPPAGQLTLSESFELLRQALLVLEAVGGNSTDAEEVRAKMVELIESDADPALGARRFPRLLRQAHDAGLIDLIKSDDDVYQLKLSDSEAAVSGEVLGGEGATENAAKESAAKSAKKARPPRRRKKSTAQADEAEGAKKIAASADTSDDAALRSTAEATGARSEPASPARGSAQLELSSDGPERTRAASADRGKARNSGRRSTRSRARASSKASDTPDAGSKGSDTAGPAAARSASEEESEEASSVRRNPRYRRGSRGGAPRARPHGAEGQEATTSEGTVPGPITGTQTTTGRRSLGLRKGSKGGLPTTSSMTLPKGEIPAAAAPPAEQPPKVPVHPEPSTPTPAASEPERAAGSESGEVAGGFFKRITAVFQRAVQPDQSRGEDGT